MQRGAALDWAEAARSTRRQLHDELADGRVGVGAVLERAEHDELTAAVKLLFVLEALPGARKVDTRRRLAELGIDGGRRLGALDAGERAIVAAEFVRAAGVDG